MARRSQPARLSWPFTEEQLARIDDMFQELYDDTDNGSLEVSASQITSGVLGVTLGGTGLDTYVVGDLIYANDTDSLTTLSDVATGNALISGGIGVAPSWGKIGLATHVSGTLGVTNGGTGLTTYAIGDLIYASASGTLATLADVAAGSYLRSGGVTTAPLWSTLTLPNASAQGDIFISTAANAMTTLVKNTTATRYLSNTGTSNNPAWAQVNLANGVTGTLGVTNGGTGLATVAQGDLFYGSAANTIAALAKDANATRYLSNTGTTNNPAWAQINLANGVTGTLPLANGGTNVSSATQTYTPTLTNVTNVAASTAFACQYMRVGNTVIVSGKVAIDPTAAGATELGISLPVASALTQEEQLGGTAQTAAVAGEGAAIRADATNDRAALVYTAVDLTNKNWFFEFSYQVL